ncbi:hypothetical protein PV325_002352 [Microctonus aethiopoides]|uniref:Kinetochore protein SPC25 n=1 Tax=Microctonus aethiopoides TaxID=144406 RepID=A0AA39FYK0_9HYME|nr:hypothetical protein PV325_002352 [Microctonus aethiopoides]KAK0177966.1 hypothetical protein PV328_001959 [Microctonus aethiopoides]
MSKSDCEMIDIEQILQSREAEDSFLQRLSTYASESRLKIKTSIQQCLAKRKEYINKTEQNVETIKQLHNKNKEIESQLENVLLQQKVMKQKILRSVKIEEKLRDEIEEEKIRKEKLTLEIVDLQQELDQNKMQKKQEWNAIKKGTSSYKEYLNMHIELNILKDHESVKITFFINENPSKDNYYVVISNYQNVKWKVDQITPMLKDHEMKKINLKLSADYDLHEIEIFLCQIREIFIKYYLRHKDG